VLTGPPGTSYGAALAAGDIDGDGFSDLLIGAPGDDTFSLDTGRVWLRRGSPTNLGSHITGLTQGYATSPSSITAQAQDGLTLASGDVNGDGKADIISGAPHHQAKGLDTGAAYFYNGYDNTAPTAVTISELGGVVDDTWQDAVDDPAFDWTDATDDDRVWRYRTYWGSDAGGSPTNATDQTDYDPAPPGLGIDTVRYMKVVAEDHACNTTETTYTFRYNGYPAVNNQTFGVCDSPFRLWLASPADWQSCRQIRFDFNESAAGASPPAAAR
jgi:hypothetical protein